jgi:hypothetical protein
MGADQIALFNKERCDQILELDWPQLMTFVDSLPWNFDRLSPLQYGFKVEATVSDRIMDLRGRGHSEEEVRALLIEHFCLSPERVSLDYWACYAVLFRDDPPGSIPDYELFPARRQQHFLLLNGEHVKEVVLALDVLRVKLTVMSDTAVQVLHYWQELCATNPRYMAAYFFNQ